MTIYEFYTSYILTGKATFLTASTLRPLRVYRNSPNICLKSEPSANRTTVAIPYDKPISSLPHYGIKISLITDPVYITASVLTDVISIPVPEPDDLPF